MLCRPAWASADRLLRRIFLMAIDIYVTNSSYLALTLDQFHNIVLIIFCLCVLIENDLFFPNKPGAVVL